MNCFKAKSKCDAGSDGQTCHRCHRLKKDCHPSDSMRRRTAQKAHHSRFAEMETKLDGVYALCRPRNSRLLQTPSLYRSNKIHLSPTALPRSRVQERSLRYQYRHWRRIYPLWHRGIMKKHWPSSATDYFHTARSCIYHRLCPSI
ncbi:hypothetical protein BJX70DRAFT_369707 [Aspergillus crustosus]